MKLSISICCLLIGSFAVLYKVQGAVVGSEKTVFISKDDIVILMNEALSRFNTNFAGSRNPSNGLENRKSMREFISNKLSKMLGNVGGGANGHVFHELSFKTLIMNNDNIPITVDGTNLVAVIQGSRNDSSDQPLMIVANYDTDVQFSNTFNPVEDNGASVAVLLALGNFIAEELKSGTYTLEHSLIFAATDLSFRKYQSHVVGSLPNSTTGADRIAQDFLPGFLNGRKFRGAIVLDNIMNFQDTPGSETNANDFSKAYPEAHALMAQTAYTGNFLALVARPDDLDAELKKRFEDGWEHAKKQAKDSHDATESSINPELINFVHTAEQDSSAAFRHFLESDQYSFWNHKAQRNLPAYPAILLTDTRDQYRTPICRSCSRIEDSTAPNNLAFAHRTTLALYNVIRELQSSDRSGSNALTTNSAIVMITPLVALCLRYAFALNL